MDLLSRVSVVSMVLVAWMPSVSFAQESQFGRGSHDRIASQELYGGVVTNQAVTVAGQDFYQYFVSLWRDKEMSRRYAISIHERPSARWGSQVWVEYAQRRVFQASLPSARAGIKALSEQAVDTVYQNVADAEVQRLLLRDPDIGSDEM